MPQLMVTRVMIEDIRSEGKYVATFNPWPRDEQREARDITGVQKRKPFTHRRQGSRWDQYGESSSAAFL